MSEFLKFAKEELERAGYFSPNDFYGGMTGRAVMELCELFDKQGHSGASASLVASLFKQLVEFKPLSPLTGEDDEWIDNSNDHYQNNRCPTVFKEKKTGKAYQMDYYIFLDENGSAYTNIDSRKYIEFPYYPGHKTVVRKHANTGEHSKENNERRAGSSMLLEAPEQQAKEKYTTSELIELVKEAKGDAVIAAVIGKYAENHVICLKGGDVLIDVCWEIDGKKEREILIKDFHTKYKDARWVLFSTKR